MMCLGSFAENLRFSTARSDKPEGSSLRGGSLQKPVRLNGFLQRRGLSLDQPTPQDRAGTDKYYPCRGQPFWTLHQSPTRPFWTVESRTSHGLWPESWEPDLEAGRYPQARCSPARLPKETQHPFPRPHMCDQPEKQPLQILAAVTWPLPFVYHSREHLAPRSMIGTLQKAPQ